MFTFLVIAAYLARLGASADAVVTIDLAFFVETAAGALHNTCKSVSATCNLICCPMVWMMLMVDSELSKTMGAETL